MPNTAASEARCRNCGVLLLLNQHNAWLDEDGGHGCTIYGGQIAHFAEWSTDPAEQERLIASAFKRDTSAIDREQVPRESDDLDKALLEVERAAYRDSNDGEIGALNIALDEALSLLGRSRPALTEEEIRAIQEGE